MRFINKSANREEGRRITSEFLDKHCADGSRRHSDVRYSDKDEGRHATFRKADNRLYYRKMVKLLLDDQDHCCYCLRKLRTFQDPEASYSLITVEHIIPRSFTSADDVSGYDAVLRNGVVLTDEYVSPAYTQVRDVHPHKVAYDNMVLSCDGTFPEKDADVRNDSAVCCNRARGNSDAYPLYFHPDCNQYVEYLKNGDIQAVCGSGIEEKVTALINNVKLGCLPLRRIRRLWYALRNVEWQQIKECDNSEDKRRSVMSLHLFKEGADIAEDLDILDEFIRENNWNTFLLYSLFRDIMREACPAD